MKAFVATAALLLLPGCRTAPTSSLTVHDAMHARSTEAAAAVYAARETNRGQPASRVTEVVEKELEVAAANLPLPSQTQLTTAIERATNALEAKGNSLSTLYASALDNAANLQRELDAAREQAGRQAAIEESRRSALMLQAKITTYAAIGFMAVGAGIGWTGNIRIGVACVVLGGILLASSRVIAAVPDWAYTVLFVTAGLLIVIAPVFMWWAYRTGLFQRPPARVGEFELQQR